VRSEPNDPFNIGLGFNLGILDNDRSNNGVALILRVLKDAVTSSPTYGNLVASQSDQRYISFDSLFGEIRDSHRIASGDLYMRKLYSSADFFSSRPSSVSSINSDSATSYRNRLDHTSQATTNSRRKRKFHRSNNRDEVDAETDLPIIIEEGSQIRAESKDSAGFYEDTVSSIFNSFCHFSYSTSFISTVEHHGWSVRSFSFGCAHP